MGKIENDHQYLVTHKDGTSFSQSAFKSQTNYRQQGTEYS